MKKLIIIVVCILIVAIAAILINKFTRPPVVVQIQFWTTETQSDRMKTIQLLMDTFQALNPDIAVKLVPVDENDMPSQMAAASAAGNLPGLIEGSSELMLAFGEEGILDINGATTMVEKIGKDRFYLGALKMVESPDLGNYYGLPYHGWVQGIWYRADWFKEAGLAPPNTWKNILNAARTFYKPKKNQYGILVGTKAENYAEQCFTHFALSNKAAEFNSKGELIFNSKEMLETLEYYAELAKYNPPGPQTWRARDYYLQG
jgi:multiple sugar transport system substrate-binding protein